MEQIRKLYSWTMLAFLAGVGTAYPVTVTFTVDPTQNNNPISPYIYGSNAAIPGVTNTLYRQGGNRLSAYNWETNWSNAGSDYLYENDTYMGNKADGPAWAVTNFYNQNKALGADSLATLPLVGYVSANGETAVQVPAADFMTAPGLTDPNGNFFPILLAKPGAPASYSDPPNTTDGVVYTDEMVNYLVKHLGSSTSGGIKFYDLDNEPAAWSSTHKEVHNYPVSYIEVASKGITAAIQAKAIDPGAQILGPVPYGWGDFMSLGGAPDQNASYATPYNNGNWIPWLNYYLAMMSQASVSQGHRLLDYLDLHVYSEGTDAAGNRVNGTDVSQDAATTRMQLPREMWDPSYTENNWISCCVPSYGPMTLIPRLQAAINQYYPGTKIAFSEYGYGGNGDISGGIAEADFLGILGKYPNMLASIWPGGTEPYLTCAFNFYLNYDGSGSKFGDTSVLANSNNVPEATVYAATNSAKPNLLNVIILNKDYSNNTSASVTFANLSGAISSIRTFRFDSAISVISPSTAPTFTANTFTDILPFRSATLYELTLSQGFATSTPSPSITPTLTVTSTLSPTKTASPTATRTFTATVSPTATKTVTATPTQTLSPTATLTAQFTSTATLSSTQTLSPSPTASVTKTVTATLSPTLTLTGTPTTTSSPTATKMITQTPTASPTLTVSASPTMTFTLVPGATNTWTASPTPTLTTTPTLTMSPSPTLTLAATNTKTPTMTPTATPTKTSTSTPTATLTPAATASPTASATPTPQATLSLSLSAGPSTVAPGDFMTYTIQLMISNGNSNSTVLILNLPTDVTLSGYTTGPSGSISGSQVFWTLGTLAPGTYTFGVEVTVSGGASGTLSAQAGVSAPAGEIFSNSASVTVTPFTSTPTATAAVTPVSNPVLYPNPVKGPGPISIRLPNYPGLADIGVKVYTTAFRLVDKFTARQMAGGSDVSLPLTDQGGTPLANGLYYVVVTTPLGRSMEKLLILR